MKNLILPVLLVPSLIFGTKIDDLEQAIKKTNISEIKKIISSITISQHDQQRLLMLADDLIKRYRSKYECHFLHHDPLLVLLECSKKEILTFLFGLGLLGIGVCAGGLAETRIIPLGVPDLLIPTPVPTSFFAFSTAFSGSIICWAAGIMHYWNVKKQYDNAIEIKSLINKATIHE